MSNSILDLVSFLAEQGMRILHANGIKHPVVIVIVQSPGAVDEFNVCANCMTKENKEHLIEALKKYPVNHCAFEENTEKVSNEVVSTLLKGVKLV